MLCCASYENFVILILVLCIVNFVFKKQIFAFKERKFAAFIDRFLAVYNETAAKQKDSIFSELKTLKSKDPVLQKEGKIRILEIGCGSGANLHLLPKDSHLVMLDPNESFKPLLEKNLKEHPSLTMERFILGKAEEMSAVADESVDAVVCTLVLCSVDKIPEVLSEVRRVLVPGGKFIFLEHVAAEQGSVLRALQWFLSVSGIWPYLFCGCILNKELDKQVAKAGFSSFQLTPVDIFNKKMMFIFYFIRSQLAGVVTK